MIIDGLVVFLVGPEGTSLNGRLASWTGVGLIDPLCSLLVVGLLLTHTLPLGAFSHHSRRQRQVLRTPRSDFQLVRSAARLVAERYSPASKPSVPDCPLSSRRWDRRCAFYSRRWTLRAHNGTPDLRLWSLNSKTTIGSVRLLVDAPGINDVATATHEARLAFVKYGVRPECWCVAFLFSSKSTLYQLQEQYGRD